MIDVCLLGTGGTVPLPQRWLTSCLIRYQGSSILIDSGEGTQIALHKEGYSCKQIDAILLTHYHADHTAGIPGLLLSMAKSDRTEPVWIIGPKGLNNFIEGVMKIALYIPFQLHLLEYEENEAYMIRHLCPEIDTVFLLTRPDYSYVSSSGVREVFHFGGSVHGLVPACVEQAMIEMKEERK